MDPQATKALSRLQQLAQVTSDISNLSPAETLAAVKHYLGHPPKKKITFPILLTEELATLLHQHDTNNRNAVESRVRTLCRTVAREKFEHTHQGIAVAYDDKGASVVLDGGKRLHMVMRTGTAVWVDITFGLSTHVFHAIDGTQPRATAQTFVRGEGRQHAQAQVASVRAIAKICAGATVAPQSVDDCEEWRSVFSSHLDWSMELLKSLERFRTAELMASMAVLRRLHPEEAEAFIQQIITGEMLKSGDPALTLRSHLLIKPVKRAGGNNPQLIVLATMNAFSAFLDKHKHYRNSTASLGLIRFRKELNELKKVKELVKFWKETGAVGEPDAEVVDVKAN
jgi:hypothetical protein